MQDLMLGVNFGICSSEIMLNCFYFISASWKQLFPKSFHGAWSCSQPSDWDLGQLWEDKECSRKAD